MIYVKEREINKSSSTDNKLTKFVCVVTPLWGFPKLKHPILHKCIYVCMYVEIAYIYF